MGERILVEAGEITVEDLTRILSDSARLPESWERLPLEDVIAHLKGDLCPDEGYRELEWHVHEIAYMNRKKHFSLRWPLIGALVRDQHEINRLILISIEKCREHLIRIESGLGRLFGHFRHEDRSHWVKQFRYLGTRWSLAKKASGELREAWEWGRSPTYRMSSRAGQNSLNSLIETNLCALSEALSVLLAIPSSGPLSKVLPQDTGETAPKLYTVDLNPHIESCLWHAREGKAFRREWFISSDWAGRLFGNQAKLNRIYGISLEEMTLIIKELSDALCRIELLIESSKKRKPE